MVIGDSAFGIGHLTDRVYKLERVGPAQVVQCYAGGFDALSRNEKLLAYHLSRAAIAGRDIAVNQHHPLAIEVRTLFEEIILHPQGIEPGILQKISRYLKLIWINNGFYDNITSTKFIPECTFEEFTAALDHAKKNGARWIEADIRIPSQIDLLKDVIFSPSCDPMMTNKSPGVDWIQTSSVNFYDRRLTLSQVRRWADEGNERYPLNSNVKLEHGKIVEDVWRAGDEHHPPGPYAPYLREVIRQLEDAIPYACSPYQSTTIRKLITFLRSGDAGDFRDYNIHWVNDESRIDFNLGFLEVYLDPRNQKGEWQASVYMTNVEETKLMRALAGEAQYFEDRAPWNAEFKKTVGNVPVANVVDALVQTGGTGPISPVGINLPNEQAIRQRHGSKSILLDNITEATAKATGHDLVREFGYDDEEIEDEIRYGIIADKLQTALHEVIGHGSGKMKAGLEGKNPSEMLPGYYSTIEEARADCVALWYARDAKLIEMGVAENRETLEAIASTMYRQMVRGALTQLRQLGDHTRLEEDHMKNRQLIVHYMMKDPDAARIERRDGKTYFRLLNYDRARDSLGRLLAELTRIKAEGDLESAKKLVDTFGLEADARLRDEVRARAERLDLPLYLGFVQPKLDLVRDNSGAISDVKISYPMDLSTQMLEYSAMTKI